MSIIKCKMCGGDINLSEGQSFGSCDSCGSTMTLPKVSDERKANLFNRANHFRRLYDFDKAITAYENILNEDNADAEAHWGVVLSRYGIEYVEDPISHNRIPTCHRMQIESILADADYLSTLEYSDDGYTRSLYEEEASKISVIQKGILSISQKEEPYDIFICYKESTDGVSRTKDSTMAQDIYYHLNQEGYKVFFSRITLEDKLGQEYEPYIFAALNSSKVMVVVGTKPEYFNAVWVKNEWSRFLELVKKDRNRLLIPCYKDMDAYDLPEELSTLQSQDMAKIGFIQDLVRGIKKILDVNKINSKDMQLDNLHHAISSQPNSSASPLLDRAFICLEDSEWEKAYELLEQVLNLDPRSAKAYIGKLMVELRIKHESEFASLLTPIENNGNYLKALRFADGSYKGNVEKMCSDVKGCIETNRQENIYIRANEFRAGGLASNYEEACLLLKSIPGYKDADTLSEKCVIQAEEARKEALYQSAIGDMKTCTTSKGYRSTAQRFKEIIEYKNSAEYATECESFAGKASFEEKQRDEAQKTEIKRIEEKEIRRQKNTKLIIKIGSSILVITIVFLIVLNTVILPPIKYENGIEYYNNKQYVEAANIFKELGGYKDSKTQLERNKIKTAKSAKAGDKIFYGTYEQDNDTSNGKEPIEWRVLAVENGRALWISDKNLDCKPYNESNTSITWEYSTVRSWLNKDFINAAFSDSEKASILETSIENKKNTQYGTTGGNSTKDRIIFLNIDEANKYFGSDNERISLNTVYAKKQGTYENDKGAGGWWLRSPGYGDSIAAGVRNDGSVYENGIYVNYDKYAVRPALWINLKS